MLFSWRLTENGWNEFGWANDIDFTPTRKYYVSSFCKNMNDSDMGEEYGSCIYGYKDDRIAELLAPIILRKNMKGELLPMLSQVVSFDVIYDRKAAKDELIFLCKIIDCFDMVGDDKNTF